MCLKKILAFVFLLPCLIACSDTEDAPNVTPAQPVSDQPIPFIEELISIAEEHSVNRKTIDWSERRGSVYRAYRNIGKNEGIREFLAVLGDQHSFYRTSSFAISVGKRCQASPNVTFDDLPPEIGYVQVFGSSGVPAEFAEAIQREIIRQNTPDKKGWIVDLSLNTGGNMYPMLGGLATLLDEGTIGHFIDPDSTEISWEQTRGTISLNGFDVFSMPTDFELKNPEAKIAVITGGNTASSGEATLIAFIGSSRVKTFGLPTCGLSTANQRFGLSDTGDLFLTVSTMADRNKNLYGGTIVPEIETGNPATLKNAVVDWIME